MGVSGLWWEPNERVDGQLGLRRRGQVHELEGAKEFYAGRVANWGVGDPPS